MDKVLSVEHLSVLDLLDPSEINTHASIPPPGDDECQHVLMVDGRIAATEPLLMSMKVKEIIKFKKVSCVNCFQPSRAIVILGSASWPSRSMPERA